MRTSGTGFIGSHFAYHLYDRYRDCRILLLDALTADARKAEQRVGWRPRVSFAERLDRTIGWYRANRPWWATQLWMREIPIITKTGTRELH